MLIKNRKPFNTGIVLIVSFLGVLFLIFSPLFGGRSGLEFSDDSFNRLSKGSSYFIPKVSKSAEQFTGESFSVSVKLDSAEDVERTARLFSTAGAEVKTNDTELHLSGNLGNVLRSALTDADAMYHNNGKTVADRYGYNEKKVMKNWWTAFSKMEKKMKKEKKLEEGNILSEVNKKAIEPSYNFYEVDAQKVSEHAGMMSGLLIFYVVYTMWWGYAIFYLFDGIGLSMKKSKIKKEA
jgi:hypothetical protein